MRTLLLDMGYQPLATISWQRAISLLTLNKIEIVESYDQEVRSVSVVFKMPAVARLIKRFKRSKQAVKFSRQNILARDRWKCQYCGDKISTQEMTMDHVVPKSQGGITRWENITSSCNACNAKKANRTPEQARMRLRKKPYKPDWVPIFSVRLSGSPPDQWASYLYWNTELET